jgi:hypothetical protein
VQPVGDKNFDVSIKIDSPVLATNVGSSQGLMVIAGQENSLRSRWSRLTEPILV